MIKQMNLLKKLIESLLSRYQVGLETSIKGSYFIFDCVHLLYYKCHKINLNLSEPCINSYDWIKTKKTAINAVNDDDKCFQCVARVALNHEEISRNS